MTKSSKKSMLASILLTLLVVVVLPLQSAPVASANQAKHRICKLQPGQKTFAGYILNRYRFAPSVIYSWLILETSGSPAVKRQRAHDHDWLNISYRADRPAWSYSPTKAAARTLQLMRQKTPGILRSAGKSPDVQIQAIANSGWAMGRYGNGAYLRQARNSCLFR